MSPGGRYSWLASGGVARSYRLRKRQWPPAGGSSRRCPRRHFYSRLRDPLRLSANPAEPRKQRNEAGRLGNGKKLLAVGHVLPVGVGVTRSEIHRVRSWRVASGPDSKSRWRLHRLRNPSPIRPSSEWRLPGAAAPLSDSRCRTISAPRAYALNLATTTLASPRRLKPGQQGTKSACADYFPVPEGGTLCRCSAEFIRQRLLMRLPCLSATFKPWMPDGMGADLTERGRTCGKDFRSGNRSTVSVPSTLAATTWLCVCRSALRYKLFSHRAAQNRRVTGEQARGDDFLHAHPIEALPNVVPVQTCPGSGPGKRLHRNRGCPAVSQHQLILL